MKLFINITLALWIIHCIVSIITRGEVVYGVSHGTSFGLMVMIPSIMAKFVEIQEGERIKALVSVRASEILQYGGNPNLFNLGAMNDAEYQSALASVKQAEEDRLEAEAQAIMKREEDRRETERLRAENEKIRLQNEELTRREREATQARLRMEAEESSRKAAEALRLKQGAAEQKKLARAPDKKKLELWAEDLDAITPPEGLGDEAHQVTDHVITKIKALVQWVRDKAEEL
jgi:hypothetical protein